MSEATQATPQTISPSTREWLDQAKAIVAYPEDYGMTRQNVRGLARLAGAIQGAATERHRPLTRQQPDIRRTGRGEQW